VTTLIPGGDKSIIYVALLEMEKTYQEIKEILSRDKGNHGAVV